jgi:hypothetical protein
MKNANLPKISFIVLILCGLFFNNAHAWNCTQSCPSGIFSAALECKAFQAGCVVTKGVYHPDSFYIYAKNSSSTPIGVSVQWYNGSLWNDGYWELQPGQTGLLIKDAKSRYASFSAKSLDGRLTWGTQQGDMGETYKVYTYTFQ